MTQENKDTNSQNPINLETKDFQNGDSKEESLLSNNQSNKLSNQTGCSNCGVILSGEFCHSCGQPSKSVIKFFGYVIKELLEDSFGYDSRLKKTILPILLKPGIISLDYVKGKRFQYVLPFKLYLITSVILILLIKISVDTDEYKFEKLVSEKGAQKASQKFEQETNKEINTVIKDIQAENRESKAKSININFGPKDIENEKSKLDEEEKEKDKSFTINLSEDTDNNLSWDDENNQIIGLEKLDDGLFKIFMLAVNPKLKIWKDNPNRLIKSIIESLPMMMFVILPIFALILKLFYAFSKRYYTEHLVFLLHNHSFIYILMMIQIGLEFLEGQLAVTVYSFAQPIAIGLNYISSIFYFWMVIYVFLAVKRFYRQAWSTTIAKVLSLGLIYFVMLTIGFVVTLFIGAYNA